LSPIKANSAARFVDGAGNRGAGLRDIDREALMPASMVERIRYPSP